MRRLYLRIYLAVVASLAVFALAAGILWRQFADTGIVRPATEIAAVLAQNALPPAQAPLSAQQAALERLAAGLRADVTLFAADDTAQAWVGDPLPPPAPERRESGWLRRGEGRPVWGLRLADGRWLAARVPRTRRHPAWGLFFTLAMLALGVGVGAYPVVRRLTRRLENLQAGVESLGAGDFAARVRVEGGDEVARLAESFNRAAARIEQLVGAHKTLLANASHELRTPLTRIRMALELMKEGAEPKRKLQLEQDVAELDALIDEILLASRLDAVQAREADEEVDLLALAAEECARYAGAELHGEPVTVRGEPRLLRRLLRNLLENASRHGAPPVEVSVARAARGARIAVCDRGPGVPQDERERVFEPFFRRAAGRDRAGAGLGLALVRQIARRHGGEARCTPREGGGSCFVVDLA
jgi:two-component system, OmpR family, sensor histidine kinase RstB